MFLLGTENPWFCSSSTDREADFCIWVLEIDGLRVPPFEHHSDGDGSLRAAGLDEGSWHAWVREMLRRRDQHAYTSQKFSIQATNNAYRDLLAQGGLPNDPQSEAARQYLQTHQQEFMQLIMQARQARPDLLFPERIIPPELWSGNPEIGKRLNELWEQYEGTSAKQRFAWERDFHRNHRGSTNLWHDLAPYHTRLDSLLIHFVEYSQEVLYPVPPRSVIMTVVNGHLDDEDFRTRSLQAAESLSESIDQRSPL